MSHAGGTDGRPLSPELLLAAACCRWPPSPARDTAVRAAAERVDWERFLRHVDRQRVAGLVHHALGAARIEPPVEVASALAARARTVAHRSLRIAAETARLARMFDAAGIPALFVKGATLEQLAYGVPGLKHSNDIDCVIPPERVEAALPLLLAHGYRLWLPAATLDADQRRHALRYEDEFTLVHATLGHQLDLHWRLTRNRALLPGIDIGGRSHIVQIGEHGVRTLDPFDLTVYLAVHGAVHCWSRLKWLADFNAMLGDRDMDQLYQRSVALGVERPFGQALLLTERLLGRRLPSALAASLRSDRALTRLTRLALHMMGSLEEPNEMRFGILRVTLNGFTLRRGIDYRLRTLAAVIGGGGDVYAPGFPRALLPLYPLLRVPLWLWRTARSGGRAGALPKLTLPEPVDQLNKA